MLIDDTWGLARYPCLMLISLHHAQIGSRSMDVKKTARYTLRAGCKLLVSLSLHPSISTLKKTLREKLWFQRRYTSIYFHVLSLSIQPFIIMMRHARAVTIDIKNDIFTNIFILSHIVRSAKLWAKTKNQWWLEYCLKYIFMADHVGKYHVGNVVKIDRQTPTIRPLSIHTQTFIYKYKYIHGIPYRRYNSLYIVADACESTYFTGYKYFRGLTDTEFYRLHPP